MPGEQFHDQTLDPRGSSVGPPLDDDVADLTHLVPGVVEDRRLRIREMKTEVAVVGTRPIIPAPAGFPVLRQAQARLGSLGQTEA